jgi:membrane protein
MANFSSDDRVPRTSSRVRDALGWVERTPLAPASVVLRWCFVFYKQLRRDRAFIRASGMAYTTLVALVPSLVLVYGVLVATGVGGRDPQAALAALFDQVFGEVPGVRDVLMPGLVSVDLTALGLVSSVALVVVAARLYLMVERAYCDVFGVPVQRRSIAVRFLNFGFAFTVGPVVLTLLLGGTVQHAIGIGGAEFSRVAGMVLEFVLLVGAIRVLPATVVGWGPALWGGMTSWVLLEVGRRGLALYVEWIAGNDPLQVVYGSLAFGPVFLAWIYLIWLFVLLGVEVAAVSQNFTSLMSKEAALQDPVRASVPTLDMAIRVALEAGRVEDGATAEALSDASGLEQRLVHVVLSVLERGGLVVEDRQRWSTSRAPSDIRVSEVVACWRLAVSPSGRRDPLFDELSGRLIFEETLAEARVKWPFTFDS